MQSPQLCVIRIKKHTTQSKANRKSVIYPCSIKANSITFSKISGSYLFQPVLLSLTASYLFRIICSKTSQNVYTGSEISIIFSISSGNINRYGVLYVLLIWFFMQVNYITKRLQAYPFR